MLKQVNVFNYIVYPLSPLGSIKFYLDLKLVSHKCNGANSTMFASEMQWSRSVKQQDVEILK